MGLGPAMPSIAAEGLLARLSYPGERKFC